MDTSWMRDGLCRGMDPEIFMPEPGGVSIVHAQAVCARCPVTAPCLEYGLSLGKDHAGVYAGTSARQRRRIRSERRKIREKVA